MKRRVTKKRIRKAEKQLARYVQGYLRSQQQNDTETKYQSGKFSCSMLTSLLAWYLRLGSSWNYKERWLDGLINSHIHILRPDEIILHGDMVWGLLKDVGGHQWKEPFSATVRVAKAEGKLEAYQLKFGSGAELSEKLVDSGSYYALLPDSELEVTRTGQPVCHYSEARHSYSFYFSKASKAA